MLEFSSNISENSFVTARSDSPRFWKSARASLTAMFGFPDEDSEFEEEEEGGVELTQADLASVKTLRHRLVGIMEYSGEEAVLGVQVSCCCNSHTTHAQGQKGRQEHQGNEGAHKEEAHTRRTTVP